MTTTTKHQSRLAVGMEDRLEEAKRLWQDLFATVLDCTPVSSHLWQLRNIIFWDNSQEPIPLF